MKTAALALSALIAAAGTPALAGRVADGSFESPKVKDGGVKGFAPGAALGDWTVTGTGGTVILTSTDYTHKGFSFGAKDALQWLNLAGGVGMGVQQTVSVKASTNYQVTLYVGSVYQAKGQYGKSSSVNLYLNGGLFGTCTFNAVNNGSMAQQWSSQPCTTTVQVGGNKLTIALQNADPAGDSDCGVDLVDIKEVD